MLSRMKEMLKRGDTCVLATSLDGRPHQSLMAYITAEEATAVYMVTRRETRKYRALLKNPRVSLFLDNRCDPGRGEGENIQALTAAGRCEPVEREREKQGLMEEIVARHPGLEELAHHPDAEVIRIKIESFLLLDGPLDAYYEEVGRKPPTRGS